MLRILRAFAWMHWRVFVNSLEKTGTRDALQRFSLAIEHIAPILLTLVMVPSALALSGVAGFAGYQLGSGTQGSIALQVVRYMLLGSTALAIVGPLLLPVADRTNPVRLLLLPIPRRTLYAAQTAGTLSDPWIMLLVPLLAALPIGMLAAGAYPPALAALVIGALVLLAVTGISALTTTAIHLVLRDRRRGELIALLFVLVLPLVSLIPAVVLPDRDRPRRDQPRTERTGRSNDERPVAPLLVRGASAAFRATPSELYTSAVTRVAAGDGARAGISTGALAAWAAAIHAAGLFLFGLVLSSPGTTGPRRTASTRALWTRVLPGLSPGASAVAFTQVRLVLRTPRGRAILFSPLLMLGIFGFMVFRSGDSSLLPFEMSGGFSLATFASAVVLLSLLPITMNQFAADGAGLTLALLSPLGTRQLLAGKAVGNGLIAIPMALFCTVLSAASFGGGSAVGWLSLVVSTLATYILASPAAAVFSALFPRVVDMNSIGRGSNAHGVSGLAGLLAFGAASLPCVAIVVAAQWLERPALGLLSLLIWCGTSLAIARLLLVLAGRVFEARRENLAMLM